MPTVYALHIHTAYVLKSFDRPHIVAMFQNTINYYYDF